MCDCTQTSNTSDRENNTTKTCNFALTQEEKDTCCTLKTCLEDYGQLIVCVCGLFFNTVTTLLFLNKKLSGVFFNRLLLCLSVIDNIYLVFTVLEICLSSTDSQTYLREYALFFVVYPARDITMCCTIYMTVILALERYTSTTRPQINPLATTQVSWTKVLKFVGPVVLFSTIFKFPSFLEFEVESTQSIFVNKSIVVRGPWTWSHSSTDNTYNISKRIVVTDMRIDDLYILLYVNIANTLVTGLVPLALLAYFNFRIYRGLIYFRRRRSTIRGIRNNKNTTNSQIRDDKTQEIILFAIVLIFLLCHILRISLNIEELILINDKTRMEQIRQGCDGVRYWALLAMPMSEILLRLNSSVNFFIYCAFNKSFRSVISENISNMLNACGLCKCTLEEMVTTNTQHFELQPINNHGNNA